ncbi:hypothetical protein ACLESD_08990 [Pyxidicoccus sp. 3LFB2]
MSLAAPVLPRSMLVSVLCVLLGGTAMASEPWRAVARVASEEDSALLERVRGQSSDLPVVFVAVPGAALEGAPRARWRAAKQLAARHRARAVLWFLRQGAEVRVHLAEPASRHLFVRSARLEGQPGSLEWSAGAEALALAVRSALRAVDAGTPLGEVVEPFVVSAPARSVERRAALASSQVAVPAPSTDVGRRPGEDVAAQSSGTVKAGDVALGNERLGAAPDEAGVAESPTRSTDAEDGETSSTVEAPGRSTHGRERLSASDMHAPMVGGVSPPARWALSVGAHSALDGYTRSGHQGLLLGIAREGRSLRLGLQLLAGLPARLRDAYTRVSLGQHAATLWADMPLLATGPLTCTAGLGVGGVAFSRRTEALTPDVEAEPSSTLFALATGPRLSARWSPASRFAFEASLSAELLLGRPALGYAIDGNFVPRGDGWAVRPRLGLAMVFLP